MLRKLNSVTARKADANFKEPEAATSALCLLCRVLAPIVVQHRHLLFDYSVETKMARIHNQATLIR